MDNGKNPFSQEDEEIKEFLATINPDSMGFDGEQEGANNENN